MHRFERRAQAWGKAMLHETARRAVSPEKTGTGKGETLLALIILLCRIGAAYLIDPSV
jgi:hypothetical protein